MLKLKKIILVFLCLLPFTAPAMAESTGMNFPVTTLKAGKHLIRAEVASTEAQREQGLMFRRELPKNNGMLFVFDRPARSCMWMKNTALPLSVAFIDANGTILNIEKMEPFTLQQGMDPLCAGNEQKLVCKKRYQGRQQNKRFTLIAGCVLLNFFS